LLLSGFLNCRSERQGSRSPSADEPEAAAPSAAPSCRSEECDHGVPDRNEAGAEEGEDAARGHSRGCSSGKIRGGRVRLRRVSRLAAVVSYVKDGGRARAILERLGLPPANARLAPVRGRPATECRGSLHCRQRVTPDGLGAILRVAHLVPDGHELFRRLRVLRTERKDGLQVFPGARAPDHDGRGRAGP